MKSDIDKEITRRITLLNKYKIKYLKYIKELRLISSKYRIKEIITFEYITIQLFKFILIADLQDTNN